MYAMRRPFTRIRCCSQGKIGLSQSGFGAGVMRVHDSSSPLTLPRQENKLKTTEIYAAKRGFDNPGSGAVAARSAKEVRGYLGIDRCAADAGVVCGREVRHLHSLGRL